MDPVEQQYMDALFSRFDDGSAATAAEVHPSPQGQGTTWPSWQARADPKNEPPAWSLNEPTAADYLSQILSGLGVAVGVGAESGAGVVDNMGARTPSLPSSPGSTFGVTSMLWSSDSDSPRCIKENVGKVHMDVPPVDLLSEQWNPEEAGVPSALQRHFEGSIAWACKNKRE